MNQNNQGFRLQFTATHEGQLLREFLFEQGISRRTLTATKYQGGQLLVNGVEQNVRYPLKEQDVVEVLFPPEEVSEGLVPDNGNLDIVYEDEALLIINKQAGQATIPSRDHATGSVANSVAGKFLREGIPATVHIVTRLDRDTSGLVCIAKNRHIHHLLNEQMKRQLFQRAYTAIVEGEITTDQFTINVPIGRKEGSIIQRTVREDGQYALTRGRVLSSFMQGKDRFTVVSLTLETGRTHQIRVHMQWMGHPLVGDDLYGGQKTNLPRQALHCSALSFIHPITQEPLTFESEIPLDMGELIEKLKGNA